MSIQVLPKEILLLTFSFHDPEECAKLQQVCKTWVGLANEMSIQLQKKRLTELEKSLQHFKNIETKLSKIHFDLTNIFQSLVQEKKAKVFYEKTSSVLMLGSCAVDDEGRFIVSAECVEHLPPELQRNLTFVSIKVNSLIYKALPSFPKYFRTDLFKIQDKERTAFFYEERLLVLEANQSIGSKNYKTFSEGIKSVIRVKTTEVVKEQFYAQ